VTTFRAMAMPVVNGAALLCSFGLAPSMLVVLPANRTMIGSLPAANILDNKPFVNIMPFGLCQSLANPVTASLTAAALGVLTPGPCTPVIPAPWVPGSPTVLVANAPAVTNSCQLMCAYGGAITVTFGGAPTAMMP
jgi:Domain of unknown function (DUF4280)